MWKYANPADAISLKSAILVLNTPLTMRSNKAATRVAQETQKKKIFTLILIPEVPYLNLTADELLNFNLLVLPLAIKVWIFNETISALFLNLTWSRYWGNCEMLREFIHHFIKLRRGSPIIGRRNQHETICLRDHDFKVFIRASQDENEVQKR